MTTALTPQEIAILAEANHAQDEAREKAKAGEFSQAERLLLKAQEIRKKAKTADVHGTACLLDELGALRARQGKFNEALSSFSEALDLLSGAYYAGHYYLAPVLEHTGDAYQALDKLEDAESNYTKALEIFEKTLSGEHRTTLVTMHKLAGVQRRLGKLADAEKVLNKGLKQIDTPLGPAEEFRYELALVLQAQDKTAEAEGQFKQAVEGFWQRRNMARLSACLESFGQFLAKAGRKADSEAILSQARRFKDIPSAYTDAEEFFPSTLLRA